MTYLLKDPGATLDYAVDWGAAYLAGDVLQSSAWTVSPVEPGAAAIDSHVFDEVSATVTVSGGTAGRLYRLTNQIMTASGRVDSRSIVLRVEKR